MARGGRSNNWQRQLAAERRDLQQAVRNAERMKKEEERRLREAYFKGRIEEAETKTATTDELVRRLSQLLARALDAPAQKLAFDNFKKQVHVPSLDLGTDSHAGPAPSWQEFEPKGPGLLGRALGGGQRHTAKREAAQQAFEAAVKAYEAAERARLERVQAAQQRHLAMVEKATSEVAAYNRRVDVFAEQVTGIGTLPAGTSRSSWTGSETRRAFPRNAVLALFRSRPYWLSSGNCPMWTLFRETSFSVTSKRATRST